VPGAALLSHGYWQRRFGGDAGVLGREVVLDEEPHTVVGVLGSDFEFLDERTDVFTAWRADPAAEPRGAHNREALARLRPGVELADAGRALNEVARSLQAEHPDTNEGWLASVVSVRTFVLGDVAKRAAFVLSAAVGFLLLMACVNIANLLLARGGGRRSEMAVRVALGAGRGRLVRLLLMESAALATVGGLAGLALAEWGRRFIVAGLPENLPPVFRFDLDARVLGFALAVTLASAAVFGLVPALRTAAPAEALGSGARVRRAGRLSSGLVVLQTALAVVLLVAGTILTRSIVSMRSRDFGWSAEGALYLRITPPESRYPGEVELADLFGRVESAVAALPGVEAVGSIQSAPLQGSNWGTTIRVPGRGGEAEREEPSRLSYVSSGYFAAMGLALRGGRGITSADDARSARVAVVNETFARRYLAGVEPVGATFDDRDGPVQVIGVVEDHVERGVDRPIEPALFRPLAHDPVRTRTLVVRTSGDATGAVEAVRDAVWSVDGDLPVWDLRTVEDIVAMRIGGFRIIAQLMAAFALVSLVLGAVGTYGVTAHAVGRRTHEIGVRMAMGADRRGVRRMVVLQGARRAALGLLLGAALSLALSGTLGGLAVGVDPRDPATLLAVVGALAMVSLLASWLPARRASGVDPVRALSAE
jgi:putative ABC transport system permease protein